jgi:hypothetical protein
LPKSGKIVGSDMTASSVKEIESQLAQLPPAIQLSLIERLGPSHDEWEASLSAMAADPEMQRELGCISSEFSVTEADGLGRA